MSCTTRLHLEQVEDRVNPGGTPWDVYAAVWQVETNTQILRFVTNRDLVSNPFTLPYVGQFLDHVHLTNQNARDELTDFLNNLIKVYDFNPLTAEFFAEQFNYFGGKLNEALVGIAYAEAFAKILQTPLTPYVPDGQSPPASGGVPPSYAPPPLSPPSPPAPSHRTDLSISVTDGTSQYTPGAPITYTIVAQNNGPLAVNGATVTNNFSSSLENVNWTVAYNGGGSGPIAGSGNINAALTLPVGANATFTVNAQVRSNATGSLVNTATIAPPAGIQDSNLANNSATDVNTENRVANVTISITDDSATYTSGGPITYTIVAANRGPSDVIGATVQNLMSASFANISWSALYGNGSSGPLSGTGNLSATINLASGTQATFTVNATVLGNTGGILTNTATIATPVGTTDPHTASNTAVDVNLPSDNPLDYNNDTGMTFVMPDPNSPAFTDLGNGVKIRDMVVGLGSPATPTSIVTLFYTGWIAADGTVFQTSRPNSIPFNLTATIPGFQQGVTGMAPGGIRQIFIPAHLAYGSSPPSGIPANADLIFEVKVRSIT